LKVGRQVISLRTLQVFGCDYVIARQRSHYGRKAVPKPAFCAARLYLEPLLLKDDLVIAAVHGIQQIVKVDAGAHFGETVLQLTYSFAVVAQLAPPFLVLF
jgi:hypothetical protein